MEKQIKYIVCNNCKAFVKAFEHKTLGTLYRPLISTRLPGKGYLVTSSGNLCDACFKINYRTTVLEYGCGAERHGGYSGIPYQIELLRRSTVLWDALAHVNNYEFDTWRKLTTLPELETALEPIEAELKFLSDLVKKARQKDRTRKAKLDPEQLARKRVLQAERKVLWEQLKEGRGRLKVENAEAIAALRVEVQSWKDSAIEASGLNHTIRDPLIDRFEVASKKAKSIGARLHPKIHPRNLQDSVGILTIPYTNGLSLDRAREGRGMFTIMGKASDHPREKRTLVKCVFGDEKKGVVPLILPVIFSRPIPEDCDIRGVTVVRQIKNEKPLWKLCLTIRTKRAPSITNNGAACGIDLGWRLRPDNSLRVAYLVDATGHHEEFCLPAVDVANYRWVDHLRSIMDLHFNETQDELVSRLEAEKTDKTVAAIFRNIGTWKSWARLVRAMRDLEAHASAHPGEASLAALLRIVQRWYYGDEPKPSEWNGHRHLYNWFSNLSDQVYRKRRDQYRNWAKAVATRYGTVFIENFDLRNVIELPDDTEEHKAINKAARWYRKVASPGILRTCLQMAAANTGAACPQVDSVDSTHICTKCEQYMKFDASASVIVSCEHCGTIQDQDYVGGSNILKRGLSGGPSGKATAQTA